MWIDWIAGLWGQVPARQTLPAWVDFWLGAVAEAPEPLPLFEGLLRAVRPWAGRQPVGGGQAVVVPCKEFLTKIGQNLEKEDAEPGEWAGVTYAEFLDAVVCALEEYSGFVRKNVGTITGHYRINREHEVFASAVDLIKRVVAQMGEAGGPGEKSPRGGVTPWDGPYPWSSPE